MFYLSLYYKIKSISLFAPQFVHILDVGNQPTRKKDHVFSLTSLVVSRSRNRNPGGKRNCLVLCIIYQHGNIMVLIIKFERSVLSPQLCSEDLLIGGNIFAKHKIVITKIWDANIEPFARVNILYNV